MPTLMSRHCRLCRSALAMAVVLLGGAPPLVSRAQTLRVTVTARHDTPQAPLSVEVPARTLRRGTVAVLPNGGTWAEREPSARPGMERLTWLSEPLKAGETRAVRLYLPQKSVAPRVTVKRGAKGVDVAVAGRLITTYNTRTGPNKPYFYPLNTLDGRSMTRHWPVETDRPGESDDHPHHRGLWFTHSMVNGVDYWTEGKGTGRTVDTGPLELRSGPVFGLLRTATDWVDPSGKTVARDRRVFHFYPVKAGLILDMEFAVTALGAPLVWGDNKDGLLGIRVPDSMRVNPGGGKAGAGHILNAAGDQDAAAWGRRADWCDYWGPVEGKVSGVALYDNARNPRHPTWWHVRDYGLFAANPFGWHDFDPAQKSNPKAGEMTTPAGETITFRYRLFLHDGPPDEAEVPALGLAYTDPPKIAVVAP